MLDKIFRAVPDFKGKQRLARVLLADTLKSATDIRIKGKHSYNYLLPNLLENVAFDLYINGEYEKEITKLICELLPKNGVFLDVGANIGSISIPVLSSRTDVTGIAIEAAPWVYNYLKTNVELNSLSNVKLFNKAVYHTNDLKLDFFSPKDKFGKGSLSAVFTKDAVQVDTITIDTLVGNLNISQVDVMKIDVEGYEHFVLNGAKHTLEGISAPKIIFEFVDWAEEKAGLKPGDAQKLLLDFGYHLYTIQGEKIVKANQVFTRGSVNILASKTEMI